MSSRPLWPTCLQAADLVQMEPQECEGGVGGQQLGRGEGVARLYK